MAGRTSVKTLVSRHQRSLTALAFGGPIVVLAILLAHYGARIIFWDQWELVPYIEKARAHTLTLRDLWAQHNEHRLLFPRLIMLILARLSSWNSLYELWASFAFALGTFVLLFKNIGRPKIGSLWYFIIIGTISACFFSPLAYENWLWGWQIQWFMSIFGVVASLYCLDRARNHPYWGWFAGSIVAAVFATYSLGNGFIVWFVGLAALWVWRVAKGRVITWTLCAGATIASYLYHYQRIGEVSVSHELLRAPLRFAAYLFIYLGSSVSHLGGRVGTHHIVPIALGIALLLTFCVASYLALRKKDKNIFWIGLGCYVIISASITAASRLGLGVEQAVSSRYTTVSLLLVIATIVLLAHTIGDRKKIFHALTLGICLLVAANYLNGVRLFRQNANVLHIIHNCEISAQSSSDPCLPTVYPNTTILWPRLQYLNSIRWGLDKK